MFVKSFRIIKFINAEFWTYVIFTLFIGQAAIFLPIILSGINEKGWIIPSLEMLKSGTLYNTAIPLLGTSIYLLISDVFLNQTQNYKKYKMLILAVDILLIILSAFLYSDLLVITNVIKLCIQGSLYTFGTFFVLVSFLSQYLYLDLETYQEIDDNNVFLIKEKAKKKSMDKQGRKI